MNKLLSASLICVALVACNREPTQSVAEPVVDQTPAGATQSPLPAVTPVANAVDTVSFDAAIDTAITQTGKVVDGRLVNDGAAGYLIFGPYVPVLPGSYIVNFTGRVEALPLGGRVQLDVASDKGKSIHASSSLEVVGDLPSLEFTLAEAVTDLEIRIRTLDGVVVSLESYQLSKKG